MKSESVTTLQEILADAWSHKKSAVQWGIATRAHIRENNTSTDELCDVLLRQLAIRSLPSERLLSYLKHAVTSILIPPVPFLYTLCTWMLEDRPRRFMTFLALVSEYVPHVVLGSDSAASACRGHLPDNSVEEPTAQDLMNVTLHVLTLLLDALGKDNPKSSAVGSDSLPAGYARKAENVLLDLLETQRVRTVLLVAREAHHLRWTAIVGQLRQVVAHGTCSERAAAALTALVDSKRSSKSLSKSLFTGAWREQGVGRIFDFFIRDLLESRVMATVDDCTMRLQALTYMHGGTGTEFVFDLVVSCTNFLRTRSSQFSRFCSASFLFSFLPSLLFRLDHTRHSLVPALEHIRRHSGLMQMAEKKDQKSFFSAFVRSFVDRGMIPIDCELAQDLELSTAATLTVESLLKGARPLTGADVDVVKDVVLERIGQPEGVPVASDEPWDCVADNVMTAVFRCLDAKEHNGRMRGDGRDMADATVFERVHLQPGIIDLMLEVLRAPAMQFGNDRNTGVVFRVLRFLRKEFFVTSIFSIHCKMEELIECLVHLCDRTGGLTNNKASYANNIFQFAYFLLVEIFERYDVSAIDSNRLIVEAILEKVNLSSTDHQTETMRNWYANYTYRSYELNDANVTKCADGVVDALLGSPPPQHSLLKNMTMWDGVRSGGAVVRIICQRIASTASTTSAGVPAEIGPTFDKIVDKLNKLFLACPHMAPSGVMWLCEEISQVGAGMVISVEKVQTPLYAEVVKRLMFHQNDGQIGGLMWFMQPVVGQVLQVLQSISVATQVDVHPILETYWRDSCGTTMRHIPCHPDVCIESTIREAFAAVCNPRTNFSTSLCSGTCGSTFLRNVGERQFCFIVVESIMREGSLECNSVSAGQVAANFGAALVLSTGNVPLLVEVLMCHVLPVIMPSVTTPNQASALALFTFLVLTSVTGFSLTDRSILNVEINESGEEEVTTQTKIELNEEKLSESQAEMLVDVEHRRRSKRRKLVEKSEPKLSFRELCAINQLFRLILELLETNIGASHVFAISLISAICGNDECATLFQFIPKKDYANALMGVGRSDLAYRVFDTRSAQDCVDLLDLAYSPSDSSSLVGPGSWSEHLFSRMTTHTNPVLGAATAPRVRDFMCVNW